MPTPILNSARTVRGSVWAYATAHKVISTVAVLIVLYGGYYAYGVFTAPSTATRYVTMTAASGTVVATMTETGQVDASHQISLSPQSSGQVTGIYVKPGDQVHTGQIVAQIDATTALQSLREAELALQNAELTYQQTTATSTLALNLTTAQNGVTNAQIALQKAHDDAYASIASIYSDLGTVVSDLDTVLYSYNVAGRTNQQNINAYNDLVSQYDTSIGVYTNSTNTSYTAAYNSYNAGIAAYKTTSSTISDSDLVALAQSTYATVQTVAEAVRNAHDFFDRVTNDYSLNNLGTSPTLATFLSDTNTYTTTVSTDLGNALTNQTNIVSAEQSLAQAQNTLQSTEAGSNALTVQQAALSLQQAKDAVINAQTTLAGYTVTAPFAGTIAAVGVQEYDQAGPSTSVATLVTNNETADISVNEVDASKLKVGQKATLTFDALPGVTLAGTVAVINSVGAVSQGVVSYTATISFDTQNPQVMPGMSMTANIITGTETGLVVPSSAVKTSGTQSYVQTFSPPLAGSNSSTGAPSPVAPTPTIVTTGLTDNTNVVIETGLTLGEQVVIKTIAGTAVTTASSAAQSTSLFGGAGGRPGGGAIRAFAP
ncbi:MAG TPA: efflux RND transporter periplasmic adaptor subunit [Candidatus Paceibacterota bacterium]|nr:efflux RND transporter periplasmic adaptor subunit [Candidatus Paceibacterota bacterium]